MKMVEQREPKKTMESDGSANGTAKADFAFVRRQLLPANQVWKLMPASEAPMNRETLRLFAIADYLCRFWSLRILNASFLQKWQLENGYWKSRRV